MATKVIMPQMGESIIEGTITKWVKRVGTRVRRDEPLFEISTDKVDSEIPSPASGVLTQILVPEGQTVQINTVVAVIDGDGTQPEVEKAEAPAPAKAEIREAPVEKPRPVEEKRTVQEFKPRTEAKPPAPQPKAVSELAYAPLEIRASPLVRRLAREHNIDLSHLQGTGLGGRITKQDILSHIDQAREAGAVSEPVRTAVPRAEEKAAAAGAEAARTGPAVEVPKFSEDTEIVPMTPMRKAIAENMVLSKRTSAHVSTVFEVDMTHVVQLRE